MGLKEVRGCERGGVVWLLAASEEVVVEWWCGEFRKDMGFRWVSSPLTRSAMKGSMMSEALLLRARVDGAGVSRSQAPPWKTSEPVVGGVSSLCDECLIREVRDVSVMGGSSRSGD